MSEEATIINEQPHSVKISTNTKGEKSWEVKVYAETPEKALNRAINIDAQAERDLRK